MSPPPLPPPYNDHNETFLHDTFNTVSTRRWPSFRRTTTTTANSSLSCSPTFSSSPTIFLSSSSSDDSPLPSPSIALPQLSARIPFSWETHPGIPKRQIRQTKSEPTWNTSNSRTTSRSLPLPPAPTPQSKAGQRRKPSSGGAQSVRRDPFFAALVECSKEENGKPPTRANSDRWGLGLMVSLNAYSCKRTCAVSESIVFLPRSRRALGYNVVNNRN